MLLPVTADRKNTRIDVNPIFQLKLINALVTGLLIGCDLYKSGVNRLENIFVCHSNQRLYVFDIRCASNCAFDCGF